MHLAAPVALVLGNIIAVAGISAPRRCFIVRRFVSGTTNGSRDPRQTTTMITMHRGHHNAEAWHTFWFAMRIGMLTSTMTQRTGAPMELDRVEAYRQAARVVFRSAHLRWTCLGG